MNMKRKIFFSYFITPLIVLSLLIVVFLSSFHYESRRKQLQYEEVLANNLSYEYDQKLDSLIALSLQYSNSTWIKRMKYMQKHRDLFAEPANNIDKAEHVRNLKLMTLTNELVDSVMIYFSKNDEGISSEGVLDFNNYKTLNQFVSDNPKDGRWKYPNWKSSKNDCT